MSETVTNDQIRALRSEADAAGDLVQAAICDVVLGEWLPATTRPLEAHARIKAMSRDEARAECARVIADAEAQA